MNNLKRLLLADDDEDDRNIFRMVLNRIDPDIELFETASGAQLFEFLEKSPDSLPDLIFLDINMPGMSGFECLNRLKKTAEYRETPVLIYSTSASPQARETAKLLGAKGYLVKPWDIASLTGLVKIILRSEVNSFIELTDRSAAGLQE